MRLRPFLLRPLPHLTFFLHRHRWRSRFRPFLLHRLRRRPFRQMLAPLHRRYHHRSWLRQRCSECRRGLGAQRPPHRNLGSSRSSQTWCHHYSRRRHSDPWLRPCRPMRAPQRLAWKERTCSDDCSASRKRLQVVATLALPRVIAVSGVGSWKVVRQTRSLVRSEYRNRSRCFTLTKTRQAQPHKGRAWLRVTQRFGGASRAPPKASRWL